MFGGIPRTVPHHWGGSGTEFSLSERLGCGALWCHPTPGNKIWGDTASKAQKAYPQVEERKQGEKEKKKSTSKSFSSYSRTELNSPYGSQDQHTQKKGRVASMKWDGGSVFRVKVSTA